MKKYYFLLFGITLIVAVCIVRCKTRSMSDLKEPAIPVKWESIETAAKDAQTDGKMILVDVYTDWCGWCKKMDRTTYRDTALIRVLNTHFHPVRLDAEGGDLTINGKNYPMREQFNTFAIDLLGGEMAFPTTVILQPDLKGMFKQAGYVDAQTMRAVTAFFHTKAYTKGAKLQDFVRDFK